MRRVCYRSLRVLNGSVGAYAGHAPAAAGMSLYVDGVRVVPVPFAGEEGFPGTHVHAFFLTAAVAFFDGVLALQNRHN